MALAEFSPRRLLKRHLSDKKPRGTAPGPRTQKWLDSQLARVPPDPFPPSALGGLASCRWDFHEGGRPTPSFAQLSFRVLIYLSIKEITNGNYYNLQKV